MNSMKTAPLAVGRIPGQENERFLATRFGDRISLAAAFSQLVIYDEVCQIVSVMTSNIIGQKMKTLRGRVSASGRIVLPAELRKAFEIEDGTEVIFSLTDHGIQITPVLQAIRQAQELCAKWAVPSPPSEADCLDKEKEFLPHE